MDTREAARQAVRDALATANRSNAQLARDAGVDVGTINDFTAGLRWPRLNTLMKLDKALGWSVGTIDRLSRGGEVSVSAQEDALPGVLLDLSPDVYGDLDPAEREEAISAAKVTFLERARQIRKAREG